MASLVPRPNFFHICHAADRRKKFKPEDKTRLVLIVGRSGHNHLFVGCELCECIVSFAVVRQTTLH